MVAALWLLALLPSCAPAVFVHRAVGGGLVRCWPPWAAAGATRRARASPPSASARLAGGGDAGCLGDVRVESYSADPRWSTHARRAVSLNPPEPPDALPPLIHHIHVGASPTSARALLLGALGLSARLADELLDFGAVYLARPLVPGARGVKTGSPAPGLRGSSEAGAGGVALSKPMRVLGDVPVPAQSYVRVHEHPKRHLTALNVSWARHIVHQVRPRVVHVRTGVHAGVAMRVASERQGPEATD